MNLSVISVIEKTLETPLTLVHYSHDKLKLIRPLDYWELFQDRQRGRWKGKQKTAFWYIVHRIQFEQPMHEFLKKEGIQYDDKMSFLYATILGREQFGHAGQFRYETPLTKERINRSFFDVVGLPSYLETYDLEDLFGEAGFKHVMDLWAKHHLILKPTKFMKMTIKPRIEVITIDPFVPTRIVKVARDAS